MTRGAHAVARLLAGAPATSINLDDLDADWRPLAEVLLDAPDRGAALEAALAQLPAPRWLVHHHLVAETISILFGPSGGGKTFVALDLALAIATGHPGSVNPSKVATSSTPWVKASRAWPTASRPGARPTATLAQRDFTRRARAGFANEYRAESRATVMARAVAGPDGPGLTLHLYPDVA